MSTTFVLLSSAVAATLALGDATDVGVATCAVVVCVADSADRLPGGQRSRSYSSLTCCRRGDLCC